jgi:uncharacterized membrane protein AbrB (regulator of aidB expression)
MAMYVFLSFVIAQFAGFLGRRLGFAGLNILMPMIISGALSVFFLPVIPSVPSRVLIFVIIGTTLGAAPGPKSSIRSLGLPLVIASQMLVVGVISALALRLLNLAPHGDMLATSPGALVAVAAVALETGFDAAAVVLYHVVRLILVILAIPLLVRLATGHPFQHNSRLTRLKRSKTFVQAQAPQAALEIKEHAREYLRFLMLCCLSSIVPLLGIAWDWQFSSILLAFFGASITVRVVPRLSGVPKSLNQVLLNSAAWLVGSFATLEIAAIFWSVIIGAILSAVWQISAGVLMAVLLRRYGLGFRGDVLATCPGGLEFVGVVALDIEADSAKIALFHAARLVLVLVTLPLLLVITR